MTLKKKFLIKKIKNFTLSFGFNHPSAHKVLRVVDKLYGETVLKVTPHIGLLHRGTKKLIEYKNKNYVQVLPYFDRIDYALMLVQEHFYYFFKNRILEIEEILQKNFKDKKKLTHFGFLVEKHDRYYFIKINLFSLKHKTKSFNRLQMRSYSQTSRCLTMSLSEALLHMGSRIPRHLTSEAYPISTRTHAQNLIRIHEIFQEVGSAPGWTGTSRSFPINNMLNAFDRALVNPTAAAQLARHLQAIQEQEMVPGYLAQFFPPSSEAAKLVDNTVNETIQIFGSNPIIPINQESADHISRLVGEVVTSKDVVSTVWFFGVVGTLSLLACKYHNDEVFRNHTRAVLVSGRTIDLDGNLLYPEELFGDNSDAVAEHHQRIAASSSLDSVASNSTVSTTETERKAFAYALTADSNFDRDLRDEIADWEPRKTRKYRDFLNRSNSSYF